MKYTENDIIPGLVYKCGEHKKRLAIVIGPKYNGNNTIGVFFVKDTNGTSKMLFVNIEMIVVALNSGAIIELK